MAIDVLVVYSIRMTDNVETFIAIADGLRSLRNLLDNVDFRLLHLERRVENLIRFNSPWAQAMEDRIVDRLREEKKDGI